MLRGWPSFVSWKKASLMVQRRQCDYRNTAPQLARAMTNTARISLLPCFVRYSDGGNNTKCHVTGKRSISLGDACRWTWRMRGRHRVPEVMYRHDIFISSMLVPASYTVPTLSPAKKRGHGTSKVHDPRQQFNHHKQRQHQQQPRQQPQQQEHQPHQQKGGPLPRAKPASSRGKPKPVHRGKSAAQQRLRKAVTRLREAAQNDKKMRKYNKRMSIINQQQQQQGKQNRPQLADNSGRNNSGAILQQQDMYVSPADAELDVIQVMPMASQPALPQDASKMPGGKRRQKSSPWSVVPIATARSSDSNNDGQYNSKTSTKQRNNKAESKLADHIIGPQKHSDIDTESERMELVFLGTAATMPRFERNVSGLLLCTESENLLFDAGDGTRYQILRARVGGVLDRVFISHLHADHVLGLPAVVLTNMGAVQAPNSLSTAGASPERAQADGVMSSGKVDERDSSRRNGAQEENTVESEVSGLLAPLEVYGPLGVADFLIDALQTVAPRRTQEGWWERELRIFELVPEGMNAEELNPRNVVSPPQVHVEYIFPEEYVDQHDGKTRMRYPLVIRGVPAAEYNSVAADREQLPQDCDAPAYIAAARAHARVLKTAYSSRVVNGHVDGGLSDGSAGNVASAHVGPSKYLNITAARITHSVPCYGFVVEEPDWVGRLNVDRLRDEYSLGPSSLYRQLKHGIDVQIADGRVIRAQDVVGPPRPGRKVVVGGDTSDARSLLGIGRDADVLVHECTFDDSLRLRAALTQHSTASLAGHFARSLRARHVLLTHFSNRYVQVAPKGYPSLSAMLEQARSAAGHNRVYAARDFLRVRIGRYPAPPPASRFSTQ